MTGAGLLRLHQRLDWSARQRSLVSVALTLFQHIYLPPHGGVLNCGPQRKLAAQCDDVAHPKYPYAGCDGRAHRLIICLLDVNHESQRLRLRPEEEAGRSILIMLFFLFQDLLDSMFFASFSATQAKIGSREDRARRFRIQYRFCPRLIFGKLPYSKCQYFGISTQALVYRACCPTCTVFVQTTRTSIMFAMSVEVAVYIAFV
ncbi:hypothetical protein C8R45DRAFT_490722 [Mycena sanguinolenta]|nr:hypothetical protein C8R45DRAFT_490722 [Mycena sanguinolenta]